MRISNDGTRWSSWYTYDGAGVYSRWSLAGRSASIRTVYVQYKDGAGNVSESFSDTIRKK